MPTSGWEQNSSYIACKKTTQEINSVNDASYRALGLLSTFNNEKITRNNQPKQIVWKMVSKVRRLESDIASSSERVTKTTVSRWIFHSLIIDLHEYDILNCCFVGWCSFSMICVVVRSLFCCMF